MRRVWALAFVGLMGAATTALAQSILNDPARRRYVLPFVRQSTDCLAREALTVPDIANAVQENRIRGALAEPMRRCADEVDAMIDMHDRTYFAGAGERFFRGPYLADLPNAILRRIQPELDRRRQEADQEATRRAEAERQEEERRRQLANQEAAKAELARQAADRQAWTMPAPTPNGPPATKSESNRTAPASSDSQLSASPPTDGQTTKREEGGSFKIVIFLIFCAVVAYKALQAHSRRRKTDKRIAELLEKYGDQSVVARIMQGEVWMGMTRSMLIDSQGYPVNIGEKILRTKTTETFKYGRTGRNRFAQRVYVENGAVIGWEIK